MFNTLDEQLFACQSLLKERRRPPTGGLFEALKESLGRGVSMPSSPIVGSKTTPGPIGAFPVGASFLVGTTKGLILVGSETLRIFSGASFKKEFLAFL